MNIQSVLEKYSSKIDYLDLDLLISAVIKKPREFVLTHPEYKLKKSQILNLKSQISRRIKNEPVAYILGKKEFYGLEFKVDKNTLIPRPETEQLVELVLKELRTKNYQPKTSIIDVGTGSGNIIISIAKAIDKFKIQSRVLGTKFKIIGIDISRKALKIARQNAKMHKLDKKINFLQGNLLEPIIRNSIPSTRDKIQNSIIIANLPYLSSKIYNSAPGDVKNYEPRFALLSDANGLGHYKKLFKQLKKLQTARLASTSNLCESRRANCKLQTFIEFSPEQKNQLKKAILNAFPRSHPIFFKDLSGRFRIIQIEL
ncbi:MAG: peptide chain release factor N(5)-glutamine methyltransferase [Candidatus Moranbacteria bacterium CG_4_9_14_3_um_filter_40_7]|nr:MAG: protein-(glutamine-N5) methyltransferase, release factor-specific [Candidatus Moranbacteria bacterium CG23_combo_of_CG06-09_8_20_14_all_40_16]PIU80412.1 MAG: peptide chain release factor N(5)-glutamine methyltransferase [Candidatus Moranbacteria bacterium CG06_land_8_20_14_3_00_40_12]PJA87983.1 MAG: peptide chain release factor N(5)-glutamine methyltransferase [Candidatus Moranbacteria bacterium CG_4_9_14_3_um_filter_40_7]